MAELEVVVIKDELDEEFLIEENFIETRSQLRKSSSLQSVQMDDSRENTKESQQLKRRRKESAETKDITWDVEPQEIMQEEFDEWVGKTSKYKRYDDCELYGKLLTKKLRTYAVYERNLLMFKIDGLLIEHPPGFDTSSHSYSNTSTDKIKTKGSTEKYNKASATSDSDIELNYDSVNSDNTLFSPSQSKRKKMKKVSLPQAVLISKQIEESPTIATQIISTSMTQVTPIKTTNNILSKPVKVTSRTPNQPIKATSSISDQPVKVASSNLKLPYKVNSNIQYQPIKVTSSVPNQPIKVSRSIPDQADKVTSISNQSVVAQASSISLPSHLPLHITIPQTKVVPVTQSKFLTSASHPKGKIVILKSKSSKYVPSSQPPILITVPSYSSLSTQCDMNSLEQLSSIAVTHASQSEQFQQCYDSEENETTDDINVVSHEVVLSASEESLSQNIVETALKNANIEEEE